MWIFSNLLAEQSTFPGVLLQPYASKATLALTLQSLLNSAVPLSCEPRQLRYGNNAFSELSFYKASPPKRKFRLYLIILLYAHISATAVLHKLRTIHMCLPMTTNWTSHFQTSPGSAANPLSSQTSGVCPPKLEFYASNLATIRVSNAATENAVSIMMYNFKR